jgi:FkbM family methyltransferase
VSLWFKIVVLKKIFVLLCALGIFVIQNCGSIKNMKILEKIKLLLRANKYKNKNDKGGIAYINTSITAGQTVLDIGAHKAGYMYFMRQRVGATGHVFAFEPQVQLYNYISKLKQLFNWQNVTLEHLALSNTAGTVTLYIPQNAKGKASTPGASIVTPDASKAMDHTETVAMETLDNYCTRKNIVPHFLKIDVEGNELKVFEGAYNILSQHKPKIIVEIEARHIGEAQVMATIAYLQKLNYTAYILHGMQHVPIAEFSFGKYQNLQDKANYCNNFIFE